MLFSKVIEQLNFDSEEKQSLASSALDNTTLLETDPVASSAAVGELNNPEGSVSTPPARTGVNGDSICLDVCCGTGTIGICIAAARASRAGANVSDCQVIGVDLCGPAIEDAWKNAEINGIRPLMPRVGVNIESHNSGVGSAYFICARADALMEGILYPTGWRGCNGSSTDSSLSVAEQKKLHTELTGLRLITQGKRLLAVVDPPREVVKQFVCNSNLVLSFILIFRVCILIV